VPYLENKLVEMAKDSKRYEVLTKNTYIYSKALRVKAK
jgi:hypothetical protein